MFSWERNNGVLITSNDFSLLNIPFSPTSFLTHSLSLIPTRDKLLIKKKRKWTHNKKRVNFPIPEKGIKFKIWCWCCCCFFFFLMIAKQTTKDVEGKLNEHFLLILTKFSHFNFTFFKKRKTNLHNFCSANFRQEFFDLYKIKNIQNKKKKKKCGDFPFYLLTLSMHLLVIEKEV